MNIKNERGSLTLFVAISMLFFMTFLLTLFISTTNQQKTQLEVTARIKEIYEQDVDNVDDVYNSFIGTESVPIFTAEQLKKIGSGESIYISQVGKYYKFNLDSNYVLKNDIELNKYTVNESGDITFDSTAEKWNPIGTSTKPFTGEFNGNGYTISGLNINTTSSNQGLFGVISNGTVENVTISGNVNNNDNNGLIGKSIGNTEINNCYYSYGKSITKINLTNTEEKI